MTLLELTLETAIREAGEFKDVRLSKEDAEYILSLLKEQEKRINELEENLKIDIPSKERNDDFDLYDTPIFGFHD